LATPSFSLLKEKRPRLYDTIFISASTSSDDPDGSCTYLFRKNMHGRRASIGIIAAFDLRIIAQTKRMTLAASKGKKAIPKSEIIQNLAGLTTNDRHEMPSNIAMITIAIREVKP
jgi:hypothetical protein